MHVPVYSFYATSDRAGPSIALSTVIKDSEDQSVYRIAYNVHTHDMNKYLRQTGSRLVGREWKTSSEWVTEALPPDLTSSDSLFKPPSVRPSSLSCRSIR